MKGKPELEKMFLDVVVDYQKKWKAAPPAGKVTPVKKTPATVYLCNLFILWSSSSSAS